MAYLASIYAGLATALIPYFRTYGPPRGWVPNPSRIGRMVMRAAPLAMTDALEWGTRRVDLLILGMFAGPVAVGIYYMAQQVASLPQKLKTSFEPILGPVITARLKEKDYAAIARQVCQVGFWIVAAQAGIGLALGIPGEALMGLLGSGSEFVAGTAALAFLLAAEVVAATAVVSEAALIYVARLRNLYVSIGTIVLQALLTVGAMLVIDRIEFANPERADVYRAAAAAAALMLALGVASVIKAKMLQPHPWPFDQQLALAAGLGLGRSSAGGAGGDPPARMDGTGAGRARHRRGLWLDHLDSRVRARGSGAVPDG